MQRLSLGSRELFHSDFLSWLFETYPEALQHVFDLHLDGFKVERERQHLDLVISEKESKLPLLIIENKVKSYPDRAQLERYNKKFPETEKRILLTLVHPNFDLPSPWQELLYKDLAQLLWNWFEGAEVIQEHRQYILDYITLIGHLSTVAIECFSPQRIRENNFWFEKSQKHNLSKIGFAQTLQKFQAEALKDFMSQTVFDTLGETALPLLVSSVAKGCEKDHVKVWSALFNNTPCVTFVPVIAKPNLDGLRFEIQIQGTQYRRLVAGPPLKNTVSGQLTSSDKAEKTWECLENFASEGWLLGREIQRGSNRQKGFDLNGNRMRSSMRGNLCFYKPDVVYQYVDIAIGEDQGALLFNDLPTQIAKDILLAFELLKGRQKTIDI